MKRLSRVIGFLGIGLMLLSFATPMFMLYKGKETLARRFYSMGVQPCMVLVSLSVAASVFLITNRRKWLLATGIIATILVLGAFALLYLVAPRAIAEMQRDEPSQRGVRVEFGWGWILLLSAPVLVTASAILKEGAQPADEPNADTTPRRLS